MNRYWLEAQLESPLVIRRQRQSPRSEGASYISGTLLRGAFAQLYLQRFGNADKTFRQIFLDESHCRFGPLDPGQYVFPLTARSCKRSPGFTVPPSLSAVQEQQGVGEKSGPHGVLDLLHLRIALRLKRKLVEVPKCQVCQHDLKAHTGFWDRMEDTPVESRRQWRRSLGYHVGIDPYTETAAESIFFSLPTLEPIAETLGRAGLYGFFEGSEEVRSRLAELLDDEDYLLSIGHAKTRGYGKVRVHLGDAVECATPDWGQWSREMLRHLGIDDSQSEEWLLFSFSLPTGAILVDEVLRYTLDPSGMIPWLPPLAPPNPNLSLAECPRVAWHGGTIANVAAVARHELVRGWNVAHGLPKQDEWAVSRGSVYVYLFQGSKDDRASLCDALKQLEQDGVGLRRNEGFGRLMICDPFHTQFLQQR